MRTSLLLVAIVLAHAGPASADDAAPAAPPAGARLLHIPPGEVAADEDVVLTAAIDGAWQEVDLAARWRTIGASAWEVAPFRASSLGGWYARIPGAGVGRRGVEYFIAGDQGMHFASEAAPHAVSVVPRALDQLAELDLARHGGRRDEIALDVSGHEFGNRFGALRDQYVRAEAHWTHQLYRALYATTFGFGAIEGITPAVSDPMVPELSRQARYGFGGVRLRAHPAVFVDARAALGISHEGFMGGIAGAVTLGRPWATNVSFGGEYLGDFSGSAFIRLQWDTAPPLLMGATLVRTNMPGAVLPNTIWRGGALVRYDVAYRARDQVTLRAAVSLGARDGGPHLGGAFGIGYEF